MLSIALPQAVQIRGAGHHNFKLQFILMLYTLFFISDFVLIYFTPL